jgi:hypothetical protein
MVGGSLRVLRLLPPLKLVTSHHDLADILLKVALNTKNQNQTIKLQTFIRKRKQYFTWVHPSIK